mmetsp:Transcript_17056/g.55557  ORF Transcript_17056/g.55557 Transcript_17056/m.55557 type:complete len:171 (-) Transcript_17056:56-568(-)
MFKTSGHVNLSLFHSTLRDEGWPRIAFFGNKCVWPPYGHPALMACVPIPRCIMSHSSALRAVVNATAPTTGLTAVVALLGEAKLAWWPCCNSLRMYGFGEAGDQHAPYHYWIDTVPSNNRSSTAWYALTRVRGAHDFLREHAWLRALGGDEGGQGPFNISRAALPTSCRA